MFVRVSDRDDSLDDGWGGDGKSALTVGGRGRETAKVVAKRGGRSLKMTIIGTKYQ